MRSGPAAPEQCPAEPLGAALGQLRKWPRSAVTTRRAAGGRGRQARQLSSQALSPHPEFGFLLPPAPSGGLRRGTDPRREQLRQNTSSAGAGGKPGTSDTIIVSGLTQVAGSALFNLTFHFIRLSRFRGSP